MIVIEDLKVSSMSKSAAGTVDEPGRNVAAKSGLNRAILDQGWYEMRRQLEYAALARRGSADRKPGIYQPEMLLLWSYREEKPSIAGSICLCGVWLRSERRHKRRSKYSRGRTCRVVRD
jgi:putative transposase